MRKPFVFLLALCLPGAALAQDDLRPTAWTASVQPLEAVERVVMPDVDEAALRAEDEREALSGEKSLRFAAAIPVDLSPDKAGTWERVGGELMWRLRILSKGARSLNFGFTAYSMPAGGRLFVYSADGRHVHRPFTDQDNEEHGQLWTPVVFGEETVIEVTLPEAMRDSLKLHLTRVNHDYRGFGRSNMEKSGACNIDVVCPIGDPYNDQDRAVGVISTGGARFCTGSLLNNTANDARPFFMTAFHCGVDVVDAPSLVVYWNYQNSTCRAQGPGSSPPGDGSLSQFNTGSFFRSGNSLTDFTLVELDDAPLQSFNVFFAGWDRTDNPTQFNAPVAIHHPNVEEKRITFSTTMTESAGWGGGDDGSHIHAFWGTNLGVTEPGSSGSPLYTSVGRFIGQLHGGPSACGAADLSDFYGRFSGSWTGGGTDSTRVSNWLDAGNTGVIQLDGRNGCTAPAAPTGVSATASAPNQVTVAWNAVGGASGYNVYRANGTCPQTSYTLLASNVSGTTFNDTTVSGGNTYAYVVRTVVSGCESANSACDDAVATGACTLPPTFAGLASVTQPTPGSCRLDLGWSAGTAGCAGTTLTYNVYRSTDPAFVPGPANLRQSCVAGTSFSDTTVAAGSTYYFVVRAEDSLTTGTGPCNGGNVETNLVRKSGNPDVVSAFFDDIEGGTTAWTVDDPGPGNPFAVVTTMSHSPTHSWFTDDPGTVKDQRLAFAAALTVPAGGPELSFWQRVNTEANWDGGVLEYSTNDGASWFDILAGNGGTIPPNAGRIVQTPYGTPLGVNGNPLNGRPAWHGNNGAFTQVRVSLADFAGVSTKFRWRFGSDTSVGAPGWWIDDVGITRLQACTPVGAYFRGDFNGDTKTDLLWRHEVSGENAVWYMDGTSLNGGTLLTPPALADGNWKIVGTHDFNTDQKTDILWRHEVSGENAVWYMNGTTMTGGTFLNPAILADGNWKMAGTGLFNGDTNPDIAWHHRVSGEIAIWYMDGPLMTSGTFTTPSSLSDTNWRLVGVANFDSNPKPDFLWHHQVSGELAVWYMNDAALTGGTFTTPSGYADLNYRPVATGDYNADNKADIVWRNTATGADVIWLMDGAVRTSAVPTTALGDANWKIVGPR